jgi:hypothetical protein
MSQYPSPYSAPVYTPTYGMFPDVLAPARRAGILLIVLGSLMFIYALCNGGSTAILSTEEMRKVQQDFSAVGESPFSPETMRKATVIFSGVVAVLAIGFIFCGVLVRRGNGPATVTALVLNSIILLVSLLFLVGTIVVALAVPLMLVASCFILAAVALFALGEFWLVQALKVPAQLAAMQQQYQMQMWHYQQQAQMYSAGSYAQNYPQPPGVDDAKGPQS